jgi:hypothetical protein
LRHPDPRQVSADEAARLATVQAIVENGTLALDDIPGGPPPRQTVRIGERTYSEQPPVFAALLSGTYWALHHLGFTLANNSILVPYLLTVVGVTLPVAWAAGLIYRMGRLFQLRRPYRAGLAAAVVLGSGLLSYAVVLNAHAPAATLVLCSVAALIHLTISKKPIAGGAWLVLAGLCSALAAAIEPAAIVFTIMLAFVPLAMRWRASLRIGGLLAYLIGITPPLLLHAVLTVPLTGDLLPPVFHADLTTINPAPQTDPLLLPDSDELFGVPRERSIWLAVGDAVARVLDALFGGHGLLSHFPVLIVGVLGVFAIMHRHWPMTSKMLGAATLIGAAIILLAFVLATPAGTGSMFAARWFIVFLPLLLFWSGAWMRKHHHPAAWGLAGVALLFSAGVSLIGATNPFPRDGYNRYSVAQALGQLIDPAPVVDDDAPMLANR